MQRHWSFLAGSALLFAASYASASTPQGTAQLSLATWQHDTLQDTLVTDGSLQGIPLSKAQKDTTDAIRRRYAPRFNAINNSGDDLVTRQKAWRASRVQEAAEIRAVLTKEQQPQYDENMKKVLQVTDSLARIMRERLAKKQ